MIGWLGTHGRLYLLLPHRSRICRKKEKGDFRSETRISPAGTHSGGTTGGFGDAEYYENGRLCSGKYLNVFSL